MFTKHKIIIGDSRKMNEISDQSIHLIITSPPYWQLKDYGVENQIGFNDSYESPRQDFFSVKSIISPEELILNNNLRVKLLGIKSKKEVLDKAINFLSTKLKNQRVFIKYDSVKYDSNGNLLVYLYLKNKTFVNAHLVKNGLVEVDTEKEYLYKNKFIKLSQQNYG